MNEVDEEVRELGNGTGRWAAEGFGQIEVTGPDAHAFVNRLATADISLLPPGEFVHALLLHDDASILDRVTIYRFPDRVMLLLSAGMRETAWEHIVTRKRGNVRLRDISDEVGVLAVRGPLTGARVGPLLSPFPADPGSVVTARIGSVEVFAARTTLDGPDGVDLFCRRRDRESLEGALHHVGVMPVSEAAWRFHRLEWGMPTIGVEIDPGDTPLEAGLEHLVAEGKGAPFPGESALAARRRDGALKRLVGFRVQGAGLPPVAARVRVAGLMVDRVRSIGRSPNTGVIGLTAVPTTAETVGTPLAIEAGGLGWQAVIAHRPFVTREPAHAERETVS